jgi:hypothetical protein
MRSRFLSNEWRLVHNEVVVARVRRHARLHVSTVMLDDDTVWILEPDGWGVVRALEEGEPIARIVRRSWLGRRWEVSGLGFAFDLVSRPAPRRWHITVGDAPVARISGSLISYNRLTIDSDLTIPVVAVLLAWHVVVRPWEAAAEPRIIRAIPALRSPAIES